MDIFCIFNPKRVSNEEEYGIGKGFFLKVLVKLFKFIFCRKKENFHLKQLGLPLLGLLFCLAGGRAAHWAAHLANRFYSSYPDYCNHYPINYLSCPTFFLSHH